MPQFIQMPEQQLYLSKLLWYNYTIQYKFGSSNVVANVLSRIPDQSKSQFLLLSALNFLFLDQLRQSLQTDSNYQTLYQQVLSNSATHPGFTINNGLLFFEGKIWLPSSNTFLNLIVDEFHTTPLGGHMGVLKTLCCLQDNFFWPHMRQDVSCYMAQCSICQQMKYEAKKLAGLLHPLPIPSAIWEDLSLNFITGLPLSNGYTTIMVVVDRYSKGIHLALFHRTSRHTRLLSCSWIQSVSYMAFHATWYLITIQSSSALFGVTCSA